MKKIVLLSFVFLTISSFSLKAQDAKYGLRIGVNLSSISSSDLPDNIENIDDGRFGLVVGFLAEYGLTQKWKIQPEIQYSAQGNKEKSLRTNYLQAPIILKYSLTNAINLQAGPQIGIKIWEWEDKLNEFDNSTFDFSGVVGVGAEVFENLFVDFRYALGLTNVFDNPEGIDIDGKNRNFQISIGYKL